MLTYSLTGTLEGTTENVQIVTSKKKAKVPFIGEVIECTVTKDDPRFGKTIKRVAAAFTPGAMPASPKKEWQPNPSTDFPYLSLKASIEYCGHVLAAQRDLPKEERKDITGASVLHNAKLFEKYLREGVTPDLIKTATGELSSLFPADEPQEGEYE